MNQSTPEEFFLSIDRFVSECNTLIAKGEFVQLSGLDDQIRTLCEQILTLSPEDRTKYAAPLQKVFSSLEQLAETLQVARDKIGDEITGLPTQKKAHTAYQKMEVLDKKNKSGE